MPILSLLAICILGFFCCTRPTLAGEPSAPAATPVYTPTTVWSGVVLATNNPHPSDVPGPLRKIADKLKSIFGYNHYELIGESSQKLADPNERWLIPSKDFYLSVRGRTQAGESHPMRVVLFQNRRRLAEFEPHLSEESPLFIRGPQYRRGQVVIVMRIVDPAEGPVPVAIPVHALPAEAPMRAIPLELPMRPVPAR